MENKNPILTLSHVSKEFPGLRVLDDISLTVRHGEFFVMVGPSGSGKSTILRIMSGFERDFQGSMLYASGFSTRDISFVFQHFALFPWLTVAQNIEFGLLPRHKSVAKRKLRVMEEVRRFRLEQFAHNFPRELSGGQRQRAGMARALATDPKIIFMDEPFSELDSFTAEELRKEFLEIWRHTDITIIMVTHLIEEALELADRIAVLTALPGRVEAVLENPLPRPRKKRAPEFFRLEDQLYRLVRP